MLEQDEKTPDADPFAGYLGGDTDLSQNVTTEQQLEQIAATADTHAALHKTEAKRHVGVAKAARQALKILREGDKS
jgi:hypothetical protein